MSAANVEIFAQLRTPRKILAVAAIHADCDRLGAMHDRLWPLIEPGDRVVYMGNYAGWGNNPVETIEELLAFRRSVLAMPGMFPDDLVYLRGQQEEMWQKLLQLQFAPNPGEVLQWMLDHGLGPTLEGYGGSAREGLMATREGAMAITRWTNQLRSQVRNFPGHDKLPTVLRRAAYTDNAGDGAVLLVHAGIDPARPLAAQGDTFWWGSSGFSAMEGGYETFTRIVRGFDPRQGGAVIGDPVVTLDAGCGFGGPLMAAVLSANGQSIETLEV